MLAEVRADLPDEPVTLNVIRQHPFSIQVSREWRFSDWVALVAEAPASFLLSTMREAKRRRSCSYIQLQYWQVVYAENGGDFATVMDGMFKHPQMIHRRECV